MTQPYLGEIQLFGFNFAPVNWLICDGTTLPVSQYSALFSLLGTTYGGNGATNFQVPNLAGRTACNQGQPPGGTMRVIGEPFGVDSVNPTTDTIPSHTHGMMLHYQPTGSLRAPSPSIGSHLLLPGNAQPLVQNATPNTSFSPNMLGSTGNSQAHENRQPFLALNFCIALAGVFPSFG